MKENENNELTLLTVADRPVIKRSAKERKDTLKLAKMVTEKMSSPLSAMATRNQDTSHINHKVYYLLCNPYIFMNAYMKISKNKGALTKGISSDEEVMKFFGQEQAIIIAEKFKNQNYTFQPTRRTWIPKPGKSTLRPIDTPTQQDRIVQEAIRGILEAIFEPEFVEFEQNNKFMATNYGFRPGKSCKDAVLNIKYKGQSIPFVIEGDIKSAYNNVDHDVLLSLIRKRVRDKRFINVIRQLLKSGVMENNRVTHSIKGTPQGGIVSPLLFNILMFEFDKFIFRKFCNEEKLSNKELTDEPGCGSLKIQASGNTLEKFADKPRRSPLWQRLGYKIKVLRAKSRGNVDKSTKQNILKEIKELSRHRLSIPSYDIHSLPKRWLFVRYADDWVLLVTTEARNVSNIRKEIEDFLLTLGLELDPDKTKITHFSDGFSFLGYTVQMETTQREKKTRVVVLTHHKSANVATPVKRIRRTTSRKVTILPDKERILKRLKLNKFVQGPDLEPVGIRSWANMETYRIVDRYRLVMLGLCNYYHFCDQTYILNRISYILLYSCAKTISCRQKISMSQVFKKYGKSLRVDTQITGLSRKGEVKKTLRSVEFPTYTSLKSMGLFEDLKNNSRVREFDPFGLNFQWRTKFKLYSCCVICGSSDRVQMHHIRSLRSVKEKDRKKFDYLRSRLNRLQVTVCHNCHVSITHGRYDDPKSPLVFHDEWLAQL